MASPTIRTIFKGAQELQRSLSRVRKTIVTGSSSKVGHRLGEEGLRVVRQLTPRQKNPGNRSESKPRTSRGHKPIWKQWDLIETITRNTAYEGVIRNEASRDSDTKAGGLWLLAALEFGAKDHDIDPINGKYLAWNQTGRSVRLFGGRSGGVPFDITEQTRTRQNDGRLGKFSLGLHHPGHKAFRMVAETRQHLKFTSETVLNAFAKEIQQVFGQGFTIS